ncbi:MAG: CarD family transcriptional regulator [Rhodospirillaceae bacterium]|nr:CarD family transcriptional regulator [Rhodospirillaceae bacterium]
MATAKSSPARKSAAKTSAKSKQAVASKNKSAAKKTVSAAATKSKAKAPAAKPKTPSKAKTAKKTADKSKDKTKKTVAKKAKPAVKATAKTAVKAAAPAKAAKKTVPAKRAAAKPATAKPAAAKPAAPKPAAAKPAAPKPATAKSVAPKAAPPKETPVKAPAKAKASEQHGYTIKDYVVYPSHGVGQITAIEEHEIGDLTLRVFVVVFDKEKMTLRVPLDKASTSGMRRLSSQQTMEQAISTLKGRARTRRVMWSRRAQEYDAKLNSGDPVSIAEVVRDLHRDEGQPDQSYSERQMYEAALERLAREFAAVENTDTEQAAEKLENVLRAA